MGDVPAGSRSKAAVAGIRLDKVPWRWLIVAGMAVAAFILGYVGLAAYLSAHKMPGYGRGWADIQLDAV